MKKLHFVVGLIILSQLTKAQTSLLLTAGANRNQASPDFFAYPDTSIKKRGGAKTGIAFGVLANVQISERLYFQTGVQYVKKGSEWTQFYDTTNLYQKTRNEPEARKFKKLFINTKLSLGNIDLPLHLMYKLPLSKKANLVFGGGPTVSIFFDGNLYQQTFSVRQDTLLANSIKVQNKVEENTDLPVGNVPNKYRVVHFSASAFLGVEIKRFFIRTNYTAALIPFYDEDGRKYKHQFFGLSIGYVISQGAGRKSDTAQ